MPYNQVIVGLSLPASEKILLQLEFAKVTADVAALKSAIAALLAKLDADHADVANASTDYAASITLPTATFTA